MVRKGQGLTKTSLPLPRRRCTSLLLDFRLDVVRSFLCDHALVVGTVPGPGHAHVRALSVPLTPDLPGDQLAFTGALVLDTVLHLVGSGAFTFTGKTTAWGTTQRSG